MTQSIATYRCNHLYKTALHQESPGISAQRKGTSNPQKSIGLKGYVNGEKRERSLRPTCPALYEHTYQFIHTQVDDVAFVRGVILYVVPIEFLELES